MKLLILLTVIACLQASARGYGQGVSLSLQNAPLEKAFKEIKKQTGYHFIYTRVQLKNTLPITCQVTNLPLRDVLDQCFRNQPLTYTIEDRYIVVLTKTAPVQNTVNRDLVEVSGRVVNESGEPLEGVTIMAKKSGRATVSNANGEFVLQGIDDNEILQITSIGYQSEELPLKKRTGIIIKLKVAIGQLDETIVMAYGKTTKRLSIGNITSIKSEELIRQPISDPVSMLAGKVPGLQIIQNSGVPGSMVTVRLRGRNSIANGNDPLYIIDGIPFPSTTLSGAFGGGGGIAASPFNNLNPADIESIEILKDADATAIYGSRGANGVILITTKKGKQGSLKANLRLYTGLGNISRSLTLLNTQQYVMMRKEAFRNDGTTPTITNARDILLWDTTRFTDWQKVLIGNTSSTIDGNASVSGGTERTQFLFSTGYRKETTVYPGNFMMEKYSGNLNLTHRTPNNRLKITLNNSYNYTENLLPQQDFSRHITLPPNAPAIYKSDGSLNWENSSWTNPLAAVYNCLRSKTDNTINHINLIYKFNKNLEFSLNGGFSTISVIENAANPKKSYDPALNIPASAGFGNKTIKTLIFEPQATYKHQFKKSLLETLVGSTIQVSKQNSLYLVGTGYSSDDLLHSIKAASSIVTNGESATEYRYVGVFGRLSYNWQQKYLATVTIRRDGSSRYGNENRFANFGSIGLGWIFTNERILKGSKWLSFGKLKFSAGTTGNDQIGDYKYLNLYTSTIYPYQGVTGFYPSQLFNPAYSWENVNKIEFGTELGFFENSLLLNISCYRNLTTNQLINYSLPTMTGFSGVIQNIPAKILNTGVELELNATIIKGRNVHWSTNANISLPSNKLLSFEGLESSVYANYYVIGKSLFIEKKYKHIAVDPATGNHTFVDFNRDGKISAPNDQQAVINTAQVFFGGWQNKVSFKKLSISVLLQFARQPNIQNYLSRFSRPGLMMNQPDFVLERWQKPGDITAVQKFANSNSASNTAFTLYRQSDAAFTNGSFFRLRNLQISYKISPPVVERAIVSELELFMQGQNLFTITSYKGLDPETQTFLPPIRMLTLGFNAFF